jgi:hypothetical protein
MPGPNYPVTVDTFKEFTNGLTEDSLIRAADANKVNEALRAVELQTQYSVECFGTSGTLIWTTTFRYTEPEDHGSPGLRTQVRVPLDATIANKYFSGTPFASGNAIFASAVAWGTQGGVTTYFPVRAAVNTLSQNAGLVCGVVVIKSSGRWRRGDQFEVTINIIKTS